MKLRIGKIPYLNMQPFFQTWPSHQDYTFETLSPRQVGQAAREGSLDAAAFSLVDYLELKNEFRLLGKFGVALKGPAQSVILFSKKPMAEFSGFCAVTEDTSTSIELLRVLFQEKYKQTEITFGRVAGAQVYDGSAEGLLLIGDEALKYKREGVPGLPIQTDLGEEWLMWQRTPFVFAVWAIRNTVSDEVARQLEFNLQESMFSHAQSLANASFEDRSYWSGFNYLRTPAHDQSIAQFSELRQKCLLETSRA